MQPYIGTKNVLARPMTRAEYNTYRGWQLPADENGDDDGMLVEYVDGGKTNHIDHMGYISWSPLDVFHRTYRPASAGMTFGAAIEAMKSGARVARLGWNGQGMFLFLVGGSTFTVNREPLLSIMGEGTEVQYHPHIDMKTAQGYVVPWLASQADMLSEDWLILSAPTTPESAHE